LASVRSAEAAKLEDCTRGYQNVIEVCTAIIADTSQSAEDRSTAYAQRGQTKRREGDTVGAMADLEEAMSLDPNNHRAVWDWDALSEGADPSWAMCSKGSAQAEKRLAACTEIIDRKDVSPVRRREALKHRSYIFRLALGRRDYDRAIEDLNAALAISPRDAKAMIARGTVRSAQGAFEAAIADFTTAAEMAPKMDEPLVERAQAYEDQGDLDKARADYEAALKIDKHSVAQYRLQRLGDAAGKRPRPSAGDSGGVKDTAGGTASEKAATAGDRAAKSLATCESGGPTLAPDDRIAACNAALAVLTEEAARQNFVLFLDRARAFAWRGWASYEKGEYDTALTDLDEAIRTDPNFKFMFFMRGTIHFAKKDFAKATADLSLAAKNNFQPAFAQLAAVYFEQKDYVSAMAQLDDALERDAKDAGALFTREKVHMALGKPADALRDCQAALAIATELKGKRTCLAEAKAQSPAAAKMEAPTAAQAPAPAALPVKPTATPATQSTAASPAAKSATSETPPAAGPKPNMKSLPKDWINAR
jgi:tetratricopeptide (TPR) repeat protein